AAARRARRVRSPAALRVRPLADEAVGDGHGAGQADATTVEARTDLVATEPAHLDDLRAVRARLVVGDRARLEAEHERARVRPALRADVPHVGDPHAGLLEDLAVDRRLERFTGLHEPGEARVHPSTPRRVRAEQDPLAVLARHG